MRLSVEISSLPLSAPGCRPGQVPLGWGTTGRGRFLRMALVALAVSLLAACTGGGAPAAKPATSGGATAGTSGAATSPAAGQARPGSTAAPAASPVPPPAAVAFAYTGPSAGFTATWLADEEGYYREQGLEVTMTSVQPAPGAQALIAGDFQIEATGPQVIGARLAGADLVYVADMVPYFVFDIYSEPEIRDAAGLRGGTIGVTQAGATTDFAAQAYARRNGLTIPQDLQPQFVGSMPGLMAALQNRLISSAILSAPTTLVAQKATSIG